MTYGVSYTNYRSAGTWIYVWRTEEEARENIRVLVPEPNTLFVIKMPPQSHYPGQDGIEGLYPMREWIRTYKTMRDNK